MPLDYSVEIREVPSGTIELLKVVGEVDLANAQDLAGAIEAPNLAERLGIVLDLRSVSFMDSSGLATTLKAAQLVGSRLALIVAPASAVARLFELAGVENVVNIAATEEQAVDLLDGAGPDT